MGAIANMRSAAALAVLLLACALFVSVSCDDASAEAAMSSVLAGLPLVNRREVVTKLALRELGSLPKKREAFQASKQGKESSQPLKKGAESTTLGAALGTAWGSSSYRRRYDRRRRYGYGYGYGDNLEAQKEKAQKEKKRLAEVWDKEVTVKLKEKEDKKRRKEKE